MKKIDRRKFLKVGAASAATASTAGLLQGCGGLSRRKSIHVSVADGRGSPDDVYTLHVGGQMIGLNPHTTESLQRLNASQPQLMTLAGRFTLTHYVEDVEVPASAVRTHVTRRRKGAPPGTHELVCVHINANLPAQALQEQIDRVSVLRQSLGLASPVRAGGRNAAALYGDVFSPIDTAAAICFHHPELMIVEDSVRQKVMAHIYSASGFVELYTAIGSRPGTDGDEDSWCDIVEVIDEERGLPMTDEDGNIIYDYRISDDILELAGQPIREALLTVQADTELQNTLDEALAPEIPEATGNRPTELAQGLQAQSAYNVTADVGPTECQSGLWLRPSTSGFDKTVELGDRTVRLLAYNAFLRCAGIYVDFFDAEGQKITMDNDAWAKALPVGATLNTSFPLLRDALKTINLSDDERRAVTYMFGPSTLLGIPVGPGFQEFFVNMPENARSFRVSFGSLGVSGGLFGKENGLQQVLGVAMTGVLNILLPSYSLASAGGATETKSLQNLIKNDPGLIIKIVTTVISVFSLIKDFVSPKTGESREKAIVAASRSGATLLLKFADVAVKILLDPKMATLYKWATIQQGIVQATSAVPFVGWAFRAMSVTGNILQLAQTTVEVLASNASVHWNVALSVNARLKVNRGLRSQKFPATATQYEYVITGPGLTTYTSGLKPLEPNLETLGLSISKLPTGGIGRFSVMFYNDRGDLVARGEAAHYKLTSESISRVLSEHPGRADLQALLDALKSQYEGNTFKDTQKLSSAIDEAARRTPAGQKAADDWKEILVEAWANTQIPLLATPGLSYLEVECTMVEQLVPLSASTRYQHQQILQYRNGQYEWLQTRELPTVTSPSCDSASSSICELPSITLSDRTGDLAYAWRASSAGLPVCGAGGDSTQAYAVQNISTGVNPNRRLQRLSFNQQACGVAEGAGIYYEFDGASDGSGAQFLLDGRNSLDGSIRVRRIRLTDPQPLELAQQRLHYGSFSELPTSLCWHRSGYLIGVNRARHKMEIIDLNEPPIEDTFTRPARIASGLGTRFGLLNGPSCVAARLDGVILVLESVSKQIQAFNADGSPVLMYRNAGRKTSRFDLVERGSATDVTYLDMSVEARGYVYVLSYLGSGSQASDYKLDIYSPEGTLVVTNRQFTAARLIVDYWRNVFTLNWQTLKGLNGRTEPTVSTWIPTY